MIGLGTRPFCFPGAGLILSFYLERYFLLHLFSTEAVKRNQKAEEKIEAVKLKENP